jgi:hypothetical protein
LFLYRTSPELAARETPGDTLSGGSGADTLLGSSGRDEVLGFKFAEDTLLDRGGSATFRLGGLSVTLERTTVNEGETFSFVGRFAGETQDIIVNWGDGAEEMLPEGQIDRVNGTFFASHVYGDDQPGTTPDFYTLGVTLSDEGEPVTLEAAIGVRNLAPQNVDAGENRIQRLQGQPINFTASFQDVVADEITIDWNLFDPNGQLLETGGGSSFEFTPADNVVYLVQLTVSDDDGGGIHGFRGSLHAERAAAKRERRGRSHRF